jgi:hypothetical protein
MRFTGLAEDIMDMHVIAERRMSSGYKFLADYWGPATGGLSGAYRGGPQWNRIGWLT